ISRVLAKKVCAGPPLPSGDFKLGGPRKRSADFGGLPKIYNVFFSQHARDFAGVCLRKECLVDFCLDFIYNAPFMSLEITYIGHASTLIEWDGIRILTDPVFSSRVLCFNRLEPMKFNPANLGTLNAILISHAHYDHLDLFSYKFIPGDVPILVPEGMAKAISPFVNNPVIELATWGRYTLAPGFEISAVPAQHKGGRFLFPLRYATCHGYVLSKGKENVYFAGDTGYRSDFKELAQLFKIKLALLPFAHIYSNWYSGKNHMNFEESLQAWKDLGEPDLIPIHWGTFFRGQAYKNRLAYLLKDRALQDKRLKSKLHLLEPGERHAFTS
ncbi:MAG: MBL fold metallo-hydrolase, partial [Deltaproteobacteria bacterium]|nr:MBL fold metallo-hydrolase [Deltaproteobacteria bacterium]